ncbi:MAG: hypothetical protein EBQ52_00110 [Synechococcaceae bacterium LLD_019]|nr:hypothetical protein [Synechococcaceae bacterium LLD_019]
MIKEHLPQQEKSDFRHSLLRYVQSRWEVLFFLTVYILLTLQVLFFYSDMQSISSLHGAIAAFAAFESYIVDRLSYVTTPAILLPLLCLLVLKGKPKWTRRYCDILGVYVVVRMVIQFVGLNILVFDAVTERFLLITQLLFFLPYSLLVWGWIYWRFDSIAISRNRPLFRLDCEHNPPRPLDYFVASFSSVLSATINAIKGNSARARILILGHGFLIYDVMGLTLSRAVALVQSR